MTLFWRKPALVTVLMAIAILMACNGLAMAEVVHVSIGSPTATNPVWVKPGSTVQVTGGLAADAEHWINIGVSVGATYTMFGSAVFSLGSGTAFADFSLPAPVPSSDGSYTLLVQASAAGGGGHIEWASEAGAVHVDGTAPVLTVATPTAPIRTTDSTPTWAWSVTEEGSGLDYFIVTLDGEPPIHTMLTSFTPSSALADGPHTLTVQGVDRVGNVGTLTFGEVYVDATPPAAPLMKPLAAGYNHGALPIHVEWTAVTDGPDNTVAYELQWDSVATFDSPGLVTATIPGGTWADASPVIDREQWFRVRTVSTLSSGEQKRSAWSLPVGTVYDNTPPAKPVLSLVTPAYTNTIPQVWTWSAPPDAVGYKVNVNGAGFIDVGDNTTCHTMFNTDGAKSFSVLAYDWVGNESLVDTGIVVIDRTPPSLPTGFALSGASPTNDNTPEWTWAHHADYVTESLWGYELRLDGVDIIDVGLVESFIHSEALSDGAHTMEIRSYDNLGNRSDWSSPATVVVDTTPLAVPGMPTAASPTNNVRPTWTWDAIYDPDEDLYRYNVYLDGALLAWTTTTSFTPATDLGHGLHVLEITSVDGAGNESARSAEGHVLIDLEKPTTPQFDPMPEWVRPEDLRFSWSAASDDLAVTYEFDYICSSLTNPLGTFHDNIPGITGQSYNIDGLTTGEWAITASVRAIDAVGNVGDWSPWVAVNTDTTLPTVAFTEEPSGTTNNPRPTWAWLGEDERSGVDHYVVKLDDEPSFITHDESWTPASNLADGEHRLSVMVVDAVGLTSEWLESEALMIDTTPPGVPGIPIPEETPTRLTTPAWTWRASEGAVSYNVYLDDYLVASVTDPQFTAGDYTANSVDPLTEGRHNLQVTAVDEVGNESDMSGTGHVVIDLTPPEVPELDPLPAFTKAASIRFVWTAVDGAVKYDLDGIAAGLKIPAYTLDISANVTGDVIITRVRAYDSVGNFSEWSGEVSTTVDRTGPTTTAVTTPPATTNTTRPIWVWHGDDAGLSGVSHFIVTFDGELPFNTMGESFTPAHDLPAGAHTLTVQGVDALGNVGNVLAFAAVVVVEPVIIDVVPVPGAYAIDRISTLMFHITGMIDAPLQVAVGPYALEPWRIVVLYRTPADAKFYVLLDEEVIVPGRLVLTVEAGMTQRTFIYEVLNERSGFGFGRLRPW